MSNPFSTHRSRYGYGDVDVRATYGHLSCQPFWTWLTGKALPTGSPTDPLRNRLAVWRLWAQVTWSWGVIAASFWAATVTDHVLAIVLALLLITNRVRGLQHTFHYTIHGSTAASKTQARWMCEWLMGIPTLHVSWSEYRKFHVIAHHSPRTFCTDDDPDQQFMSRHGFHSGMSEAEFWWCVFTSPFRPSNILAHLRFRFEQNFIVPPWPERRFRIAFWVAAVIFFAATGLLFEVFAFYLFPALILLQYSSYMQHITEHLWFPPEDPCADPNVYYASLTWGRFLGRPHPSSLPAASISIRIARTIRWWATVFLVDLPLRVFVFMQDLSSHDFHHRSALVHFWAIERERANSEGESSRWGPMTEVWSYSESVRILRDHLVRDVSDPFGIYEWDRSRHASVRASA